ncbi:MULTISPECIES: hypothetical protein [Streptomyces]|uniref:Uncharacterized protein n=1 Tax=Streptomyces katrae TaxID=68223 RepID=A0A0F4JMW6_9ACTN|nr:hypothetical protein [Streptomyces katrae]KJY35530.1 hypothetical protein VR44_09985 [Streptomyces katrae]
MHAFTHDRIHAARTAELAAEAAAWHLAHEAATATATEAAPAALPARPTLRNRLGKTLVAAGIRLMQPEHLHARPQRHAV